MNTKLAVLFGLFLVPLGAGAQWVVYDPAVHAQAIMSTAQEIAKYVQMIQNQVQQIGQLTEQVNTLHHYVDLFGDPKEVGLIAGQALRDDLLKSEVGQTLGNLVSAVDSASSFAFDGGGIFHVVGKDFVTPGGKPVPRLTEPYLPIAAIQKATQNYLAVSTDAANRRAALKGEMAKTTEALKAAKTDAEVQKLTALMIGLSAALDAVDHEVNQATASALVQDVAVRTDEKRQVEAKKEAQHAEFTEATGKYGQTFRLLAAPVKFPTR